MFIYSDSMREVGIFLEADGHKEYPKTRLLHVVSFPHDHHFVKYLHKLILSDQLFNGSAVLTVSGGSCRSHEHVHVVVQVGRVEDPRDQIERRVGEGLGVVVQGQWIRCERGWDQVRQERVLGVESGQEGLKVRMHEIINSIIYN